MADQILFDRLAYMDRLKRAGVTDEHARAHAEAIDEALRESVATKHDLGLTRRDLHDEIAATRQEIALLRRDMIVMTGSTAIALFAALTAIKFFA
jgi:hypothetical protein